MRGTLKRIAAFASKEAVELLHQPRLIASMVLGPFAILALFGAGLSTGLPTFRAVFVAEEAATAEIVERNAAELASYIDFEGVVDDEAAALDRLRAGEVDVVAVLPNDPLEFLRRDRRAVIEVYHDALDPVIAAAVEGAARLAADELNRQILTRLVARAQGTTTVLADVLPTLHTGLSDVRASLAAGESQAARDELVTLDRSLDVLADAGVEALRFLRAYGGERLPGPTPADLAGAAKRLDPEALQRSVASLSEDVEVVASAVEVIADNLVTLSDVRAEVLIRPFVASTGTIDGEIPEPLDFYLPSVLMLLLQHLGITFSALSLVRERELGSLELFTVAPVTAGDVLLGKCLAYLGFGGAVAAIVGLPMWHFLGLPLSGTVGDLLLGMGAVLLASVAGGFLISLVSRTPSQAVQLALLTLLASFFFSGFFLPLDRLAPVASFVGAFLPVTHGISIAQEVVLRGHDAPSGDLGQLLAIAAGAGLVTWRGFRRAVGLR